MRRYVEKTKTQKIKAIMEVLDTFILPGECADAHQEYNGTHQWTFGLVSIGRRPRENRSIIWNRRGNHVVPYLR